MRCSPRRDQHDWETVAAPVSMAARDLEGSVRRVRKELFQFVGVLRVTETITQQDRSVFEISGLPSVQKMVGGCQRRHVTGV